MFPKCIMFSIIFLFLLRICTMFLIFRKRLYFVYLTKILNTTYTLYSKLKGSKKSNMELKVLFAMTNLHNARNNILTRRGLSKLPFVCWSPPWTQNCVASVRNKQYFDQRLLKVEVFSKRLNPCNKFFQSSFIS